MLQLIKFLVENHVATHHVSVRIRVQLITSTKDEAKQRFRKIFQVAIHACSNSFFSPKWGSPSLCVEVHTAFFHLFNKDRYITTIMQNEATKHRLTSITLEE
jgi:hypothetical protein